MKDVMRKRWRRDCFIVSCLCMLFARVTVNAEAESGNTGRGEPVFYFIPGQRAKSGTAIGMIKRPEYAWNKAKESVYGKITWYEAQNRCELEEDMELSGEAGDIWKLIWIFEPDPRFGTYENAEGIVSITITQEDVPDYTVDASVLEKAWNAFMPEDEQEKETEELGENLEAEEKTENSIVVEIPSNDRDGHKKDEIYESVSGITNGPVKVTSDEGIPGNLLNGVGSAITGVGAVGNTESGLEEWYVESNNYSDEIENMDSNQTEYRDALKEDDFNDTESDYPAMITENSDREESMLMAQESSNSGSSFSETEKSEKSETRKEAPKTGDTISTAFWKVLLLCSAAIIVTVYSVNGNQFQP